MIECPCTEPHERRRIVLTGGPGAGKTAVLELVRQYFCKHIEVLPEAASILFGGGFPREAGTLGRCATQRAIFHVQRELEVMADVEDNRAIVLCDRGTVDGFAYWPGPADFWASVGTTREQEIARYDTVVQLRTPTDVGGYNRRNPVRIESAAEAGLIDQRIIEAWRGHPRCFVVENTRDFMSKAHRAIEIIRGVMPGCCRQHLTRIEAPPAG